MRGPSSVDKISQTRQWLDNHPSAAEEDTASDHVIPIHTLHNPPQSFSMRKYLAHLGPGFLMVIAFMDPGNLEADLQTGAHTGYSLLWLLLISTAMGFLLQSLSARLGIATGKHLAQHCRSSYNRPTRLALWLMAEMAIIGCDIQEVIGTAIALRLLTNGALPLWAGTVLGAIGAYLVLISERFGARWLEALFQVFVAVLAITMGSLFFMADVPYKDVLHGLFVPKFSLEAIPTAGALIGSIIMPYNLYLHSALLHNRPLIGGSAIESCGLRESMFYYNLDSASALIVSLFINIAVISVFSKGFFGRPLPSKGEIGLENAGQYLGSRFGSHMQWIWGLGLLAAGHSSTMSGTLAGQHVFEGYFKLRIRPFTRALITRAIALGPTLLVALSARHNPTRLDAFNQWVNVFQAVQLPFVVVPLLALTSDRRVMGIGFANNNTTKILSWSVAFLIIGVNAGVVGQTAAGWLKGQGLTVLEKIVFVLGVGVYLGFIAYLVWVVERRVSHGESQQDEEEEEGELRRSLLMEEDDGHAGVSSAGSKPIDTARSQLTSHAVAVTPGGTVSL